MDEYLTSVPPPPPVPETSPFSVTHIRAAKRAGWKTVLGVVVGVLVILGTGIGTGVVLENKLYRKPAVITASPTPSPSADPTANWKTYASEKFGFSFRYPETWKDVSDPESATEFKIETTSNEVVLGTIFDGKADKAKDKSWARKLDLINNKSILISYMQCAGMGCKEGSKDISIFDQILSTFKFLDQNQTYTCPQTAWVNCMPGPNSPQNPQCSDDYYSWAKKNCPNFQGLAR